MTHFFRKGDRIICEDDRELTDCLTRGKQYRVIESNLEQHECIVVQTDNGVNMYVDADRFEPVVNDPVRPMQFWTHKENGNSYRVIFCPYTPLPYEVYLRDSGSLFPSRDTTPVSHETLVWFRHVGSLNKPASFVDYPLWYLDEQQFQQDFLLCDG